MKIGKSLTTFCLFAIISSCGGVSDDVGDDTTSLSVDIFHGRGVPPDPGAAANATIAGVDENQNGIRDEVDRYIAKTYGADTIRFNSAQILAKANQLLLITPASDFSAAVLAVNKNAEAGFCLAEKFKDNRLVAIQMNSDIVRKTFNTKNRQLQLQEMAFKVGQFARRTEVVTCR